MEEAGWFDSDGDKRTYNSPLLLVSFCFVTLRIMFIAFLTHSTMETPLLNKIVIIS